MGRLVIQISALLIMAIAISEIHIVVLKLFPQTGMIEKAFWLDKNHKEKISVIWYIYELSNIVNKMIWMYCFMKVSKLVSHKLANVIIVFFGYYITQLAFYVWDRNTVLFSNFIVYIYVGIAILILFIPSRKGGKLINIEDY